MTFAPTFFDNMESTLKYEDGAALLIGGATYDAGVYFRYGRSVLCNADDEYYLSPVWDADGDGLTEVNTNGPIWVSFHFRWATLPSTTTVFVNFGDPDGDDFQIRIDSDGTFRVLTKSGAEDCGAAAISAETWYQISVRCAEYEKSRFVIRNTTAPFAEVLSYTAAANHGNYVGTKRIGLPGDANSGVVNITNVVVSDANYGGSDEDPFTTLGADYYIETLRPSANGTYQEEVASGSYADIDDAEGTADYVDMEGSTGNTCRVTYHFPDLAQPVGPGVPFAVMPFFTGRGLSSSVGASCYALTRVDGSDYLASAQFGWGLSTDNPRTLAIVYPLNPKTGVAWTMADISGMEAGWSKNPTRGSRVYWGGILVLTYMSPAGLHPGVRRVPGDHTMGAYMRPHQRIAGV